ncbi:Hypothetical predicted protein, partial [Podarcis lilfordi]
DDSTNCKANAPFSELMLAEEPPGHKVVTHASDNPTPGVLQPPASECRVGTKDLCNTPYVKSTQLPHNEFWELYFAKHAWDTSSVRGRNPLHCFFHGVKPHCCCRRVLTFSCGQLDFKQLP